jgi:hypothetical protein
LLLILLSYSFITFEKFCHMYVFVSLKLMYISYIQCIFPVFCPWVGVFFTTLHPVNFILFGNLKLSAMSPQIWEFGKLFLGPYHPCITAWNCTLGTKVRQLKDLISFVSFLLAHCLFIAWYQYLENLVSYCLLISCFWK